MKNIKPNVEFIIYYINKPILNILIRRITIHGRVILREAKNEIWFYKLQII